MFKKDFLQELEYQKEQQNTCAVAFVVRREAPTSGKPGDKAVILDNGEVKGWIGGGCTKGIVVKEALAAIKEKTPRLVRIMPGQEVTEQEGVKNYKMTCMSGGSVEVYIEPVMPTSKITIYGRSHIAKALCEIGNSAGFEIDVISNVADAEMFPKASNIYSLENYTPKENTKSFTVVCTQGEDDTTHLLTALKENPSYISFVASMKKAASIFGELKMYNVGFDLLEKIKTPAGLDINAKIPEEVAISILAQIIQHKRTSSVSNEEEEKQLTEDLYINPVCNIPVQKSSAKYVFEHNGEKVYFCCDGCKEKFEAEPDKYITT